MLWLGTFQGGLDKYDRAQKAFRHYTQDPGNPKSLSYKVVNGIFEDRWGVVWVGTYGGLNRFDRATETFTHYNNDPTNPRSLGHNDVTSVLEDSEGILWLGTSGGGLERFDRLKGRFIHYKHDPRNPKSLSSDFVWPLCEDKSGTLWIGTSGGGGLNKFDRADETFTHYEHDPKNPNSLSRQGSVTTLCEDRSGMLWVGTTGSGLNKFDRVTGNFTHYVSDPQKQNSLSNNSVASIYEDSRGTLWIGTYSGVDEFNPATETFTSLKDKDGVLDNAITGILEDNSGCLWLNTGKGLSKFNTRTGTLRNYDASDGVTIGQQLGHSFFKNRSGELFFGGTNGFIRFHPDSIRDNPYVPPIVITAFKKFDKLVPLDTAISEKKVLELSYQDNVFSFEFVALNYSSPERNQYAYKLEGFDKDWTYCGTRRYASYTNLDGGTYVFRVKGSNNDGIWNEEGTSILVTVTPPFWKTWWFVTIFFVTIAVSIGGAIRYIEITKLRRRMRALEQQQALERERLRISNDLHDELASNLSSIGTLSKILHDGTDADGARPAQAQQLLGRIANLSKESVDSIRDIIWAIDPKEETLENLLIRLRDMVIASCRAKNIHFQFEQPRHVQIPSSNLPPDLRRQLWLLLKEAVNNALKHSHCTELSLCVEYGGGMLKVIVRDNGLGFDPAKVSKGKGLGTMKMRSEQIGASLELMSRIEEGTSIAILLKL